MLINLAFQDIAAGDFGRPDSNEKVNPDLFTQSDCKQSCKQVQSVNDCNRTGATTFVSSPAPLIIKVKPLTK